MDSPILPPDAARPETNASAAPPGKLPDTELAGRSPGHLLGEIPPPPPLRQLTADDLGMPPRRRVLPLVLFLATCFFTYAAGTYGWIPVLFGQHIGPRGEYWNWRLTYQQLAANWQNGLIYMACVMGVLLAHEMGHFVMTVRYRIPASYPIFIPVPIMFIGTMGAVIGMQGYRANRRQMFDIGIAGPLAGLVLAVPMVIIGIKTAEIAVPNGNPSVEIGDPLLMKILVPVLRPDVPQGADLYQNAVLMAGWVGIFITGLNMLPVSQLDGGHVSYGLFLRNSYILGRVFFIAAITFVILSKQYGWTMMLLLIMAIGVEHPPTFDDRVPLGPVRTIIGLLSLAIPVLCFTPYPLYLG